MSKELTHRAEELKALGWSNDEVVRYAELWDYRQRWGAINLERDDRQFLRKAEAALPKITTGKTSVKKPIREKSYYRWLLFYLDTMNKVETDLKLPDGARGTWPILIEEELRAIDYFEPVLGLPDTLKAKRFDEFREELINSYSSLSNDSLKLIDFDFNSPLEELKAKESTKWRTLRSETVKNKNYHVLKPEAVAIFRDKVRKEFLPLILETLPSLSESDKPTPPDDWSSN